MCCRTVHDGVTYKPGDRIPVRSAIKTGQAKWTGFARSETAKAIWKLFDAELDIPAEKFAENNRVTGGRTYGALAKGYAIQGIGNRQTGEVKILTREATPEEKDHFGHDRLPVTGLARF